MRDRVARGVAAKEPGGEVARPLHVRGPCPRDLRRAALAVLAVAGCAMAAIQRFALRTVGLAVRHRRRHDDLGPGLHPALGFELRLFVGGDDAQRCGAQLDAFAHAVDRERSHSLRQRGQVVVGHPPIRRHRRAWQATTQRRDEIHFRRHSVLRACELEHPVAERARTREQQRLDRRVAVAAFPMACGAVPGEQRMAASRFAVCRCARRATRDERDAGHEERGRDPRAIVRAQRRHAQHASPQEPFAGSLLGRSDVPRAAPCCGRSGRRSA